MFRRLQMVSYCLSGSISWIFLLGLEWLIASHVLLLWTLIQRSRLPQAPLLLILRIFGALLVLFSISLSLGWIFHMQFSRFAFICTTLESLTSLL